MGDPFHNYYLKNSPNHTPSNPGTSPLLPPELMGQIYGDAIACGFQSCIFNHFIPKWGLCDSRSRSDTRRVVWQTYITPEDPKKKGTLFHNHRHQCIKVSWTDLLDPDISAETRATDVRVALEAYEKEGIREATKRLAMCYGTWPEYTFVPASLGDLLSQENIQSIENGRPLAIEPRALHELPFRADVIPEQYRGCQNQHENQSTVSKNISVLAITVPGIDIGDDPDERPGPGYNLMQFLTADTLNFLDTESLDSVLERIVADRRNTALLDWSKFNRKRLRAVFLDLRAYATGDLEEEDLLRTADDMSRHFSLDVLCIAGTRSGYPWMDRIFTSGWSTETLEGAAYLIDGEGNRHVNPIAAFRGALRPGGRIILVDACEQVVNIPQTEANFPEVSLVM